MTTKKKARSVAQAVREILEDDPQILPDDGVERLRSEYGIDADKAKWNQTRANVNRQKIDDTERVLRLVKARDAFIEACGGSKELARKLLEE